MQHQKIMELDLPCGVFYNLQYLVLDLDGTLTTDGRWIDGVVERLKAVSQLLTVYILTSDTNQTAHELTQSLVENNDIHIITLEAGRGDVQKLEFIADIGCEYTAAIGNGCNDAIMLKNASLGICVIGKEGASQDALLASKVVFTNILDALDIFLYRKRLIATLRK